MYLKQRAQSVTVAQLATMTMSPIKQDYGETRPSKVWKTRSASIRGHFGEAWLRLETCCI